MTSRRNAPALVAVVAVALLLSGCAAEATPEPTRYIGATLHDATAHLGPSDVVDLDPQIVGTPESYTAASDPAAWIVVAACYASNPQKSSTLGVLSTTAMTDAIRRAAKHGDYNTHMVCKPWK